MQMNKITQLPVGADLSCTRLIAPTADLSALIGITLRKIPSNSVGARAVRSGGVGLYGRPRPLHLASTLGEHDYSPLAGDHKGPPTPSSSALAPTDRAASCLAFRLRLMPIIADLSALRGWSAIQSILLKLIIAPRRQPCLK